MKKTLIALGVGLVAATSSWAGATARPLALRVNETCADLLGGLHRSPHSLLEGKVVSLQACGGTEQVDLFASDLREKCVTVHVCPVTALTPLVPVTPPTTPQPRRHHWENNRGGDRGPPDNNNYNGVSGGYGGQDMGGA